MNRGRVLSRASVQSQAVQTCRRPLYFPRQTSVGIPTCWPLTVPSKYGKLLLHQRQVEPLEIVVLFGRMSDIRYLLDENVNPLFRTELLKREPELVMWRVC